MSPTQLELQRLQRGLRGRKVVSAGRSAGNCILINFSANRGGRRSYGTKPGLMVELAEWELRRGGSTVASSCPWRRVISSAVPQLSGARITYARIEQRGIELAFEKGFALTVTTLMPSQLGPGWRLDQWVLFREDGAAICQPVVGRITWADKS